MSSAIPQNYRKVVVTSLTNNFREAVQIQTCKTPSLTSKTVLVRNRYVGINASDVNFSAGKYTPGLKPPFDIGFEAIGEIVATSDDAKELLGKPVAHMAGSAFTEYQKLPTDKILPIPEAKPDFLPFLVSGMTAKLALDMNARLKAGEKVLVTAAAGGTGQFAVQLAKLAGCHVIGTCSSEKKVKFLKSIGCDRVINTSEEELENVLKKEYEGGVDVVYESIGGTTYDICVNALAIRGRLIVIGRISEYQDSMGVDSSKSLRDAAVALPMKLLRKSASVNGFFLLLFPQLWKDALSKLTSLYAEGKLKSFIDQGEFREGGSRFCGIEAIPDAVEYLFSRKNMGKVYVDLFPKMSSRKTLL